MLELDTCEFLIGSVDDRLDLRDVYVFDKESGLYGSVAVEGQLPKGPTMFQMVPWTELYLGDSLTNKPEEVCHCIRVVGTTCWGMSSYVVCLYIMVYVWCVCSHHGVYLVCMLTSWCMFA